MTDKKMYIKERDYLFEIMKSGNNQEVIRWYDENATLYDEQFNSCGFVYHLTTVETVCKVTLDKAAVILDVGAGSGIIGKLLQDHGYSTIDAVDASEGMLKVAGQENIYRSLICAKIGTELIQDLETCFYDVLVSGGLFGPGTVYYESIPFLLSYLKPGIYDVLVSGGLFGPGTVYYESIPSLLSYLKAGGYLIFSIAGESQRLCPRLGKEKLMKMTTEWEHENVCRFITEKKTYHINKEPASVIVLQKI